MSVSILKTAADAIVSVLADPTNGFNAQLATLWMDQNVPGQAWEIDWSDDSANFYRSRLSITDLYQDEQMTLPAVTLWEAGDQNTNEVVTSTFSGPMAFIVEQHIVVPAGSIRNFEKVRYAVHDAMFNCFNSTVPQTAFLRANITYNGRLMMLQPGQIISPTDEQGQDMGDLLQSIQFRLDFDIFA